MQPLSLSTPAIEVARLEHKMLRKRKRGLFNSQSFCLVCVFFSPSILLRGKTATLCVPTTHPLLVSPSPKPSHLLKYSLVTPAFSPNVNPNRLSTEGYCSSSQKRRQIFRYWGAVDLDLCVAMPIYESCLVMIVVTCDFYPCLA